MCEMRSRVHPLTVILNFVDHFEKLVYVYLCRPVSTAFCIRLMDFISAHVVVIKHINSITYCGTHLFIATIKHAI